jgi:hypothetical protein
LNQPRLIWKGFRISSSVLDGGSFSESQSFTYWHPFISACSSAWVYRREASRQTNELPVEGIASTDTSLIHVHGFATTTLAHLWHTSHVQSFGLAFDQPNHLNAPKAFAMFLGIASQTLRLGQVVSELIV